MRPHLRRGVTLIELMVAVFVVGIIIALVVMAMPRRRGDHRRAQCLSNMRNVGFALNVFQNAKRHYPNAGTFYDDPAIHQADPLKSTIYRAITNPGGKPQDADLWLRSWVIDVFPELDLQDLYNTWDKQKSYLSTAASDQKNPDISNSQIASTAIGVLTCPDDLTLIIWPRQPQLCRQWWLLPLARDTRRLVREPDRWGGDPRRDSPVGGSERYLAREPGHRQEAWCDVPGHTYW